MATARWRGSKNLHETPTSPKFGVRGNADTCTRTFEGPYAKCVANKPSRGDTMDGISDDYKVVAADVDRQPGDKGVLIVVLEKGTASVVYEGQVGDSVHEIDYVELQKPLASHPRYQSGGAKTLSDDDLAALERWRDETNASERADYKYRNDPDDSAFLTLGANAQDYAAKVLRGADAYNIYPPVVRRTREYLSAPTNTGAGKRFTAAQLASELGISVPTEYGGQALVYLQTADRSQQSGKQGRWERAEEWTGAWEWDEDLYEATS